ncbi:hypothetical protein MC885_001992 [Smutsia gigantea]|nr:hypothetical protein MC885_001992 [Smutsia gigantea]
MSVKGSNQVLPPSACGIVAAETGTPQSLADTAAVPPTQPPSSRGHGRLGRRRLSWTPGPQRMRGGPHRKAVRRPACPNLQGSQGQLGPRGSLSPGLFSSVKGTKAGDFVIGLDSFILKIRGGMKKWRLVASVELGPGPDQSRPYWELELTSLRCQLTCKDPLLTCASSLEILAREAGDAEDASTSLLRQLLGQSNGWGCGQEAGGLAPSGDHLSRLHTSFPLEQTTSAEAGALTESHAISLILSSGRGGGQREI